VFGSTPGEGQRFAGFADPERPFLFRTLLGVPRIDWRAKFSRANLPREFLRIGFEPKTTSPLCEPTEARAAISEKKKADVLLPNVRKRSSCPGSLGVSPVRAFSCTLRARPIPFCTSWPVGGGFRRIQKAFRMGLCWNFATPDERASRGYKFSGLVQL